MTMTTSMTLPTLCFLFIIIHAMTLCPSSSSPLSYCNAANTDTDIEIKVEIDIEIDIDIDIPSSFSPDNNINESTTNTTTICTTCNTTDDVDNDNDNDNDDDDDNDNDDDDKLMNRKADNNSNSPKNECKLYMAPSLVGGGYGLFTSRDLKKGQTILGNWNNTEETLAGDYMYDSLLDGPNIPALVDNTKSSTIGCDDKDINSDASSDAEYCSEIINNPFKTFNNVWWGPHGGMSDRMWREIDIDQEDTQISTVDYQINFGALPNFHPYKSNLHYKLPSDGIVYDDYTYLKTGDDGTTNNNNNNNNNNKNNNNNNNNNNISNKNNPLKGSFSYYKGRQFIVFSDVKAGEEIFLDYADSNLDRNSNPYTNRIPRRQDYFNAAVIIRKFLIKGSYIKKKPINNEKESESESKCDNIDSGSDRSKKYSNDSTMKEITLDVLKSIKTFKELLPYDNNHEDGDNSKEEEEEEEEEETTKAIDQIDNVMTRIFSLVPTDEPTLSKIIDKAIKNHQLGFNIYDNDSTNKTKNTIPSVKDFADAIYTEYMMMPPKTPTELNADGMCLDHIISGISKTPIVVVVDDNSNSESESSPPSDDSTTVTASSTTASTSTTTTIGRGAIAQRLIKKDDMVVPVPLLHLLDRSLLKHSNKDELLINYCFGHHESSMIFCPITNAILINHCSASSSAHSNSTDTGSDGDNNGNNDKVLFSCGHGDNNKNKTIGPNAIYRWASSSSSESSEGQSQSSQSFTGWDPQTDKTLKMTINEIARENNKENTHRLLSMEIIALRDIKPGEEIFIDYGKEWENAWLEHVKSWNKSSASTSASTMTEYEMNKQKDIPISSWFGGNNGNNVANGLQNNQPATSLNGRYQAMCWYKNMLPIDLELGFNHNHQPHHPNHWKRLSDADIYDGYALDAENNFNMERANDDDHGDYDSEYGQGYGQGDYSSFWPCSVLAKVENEHNNNDNNKYIVRIYPSGYHDYPDDTAEHLLIKNYPRESIRFFTLPNHGDQYLKNSFRHHIEIRDEIFPNQWKNIS